MKQSILSTITIEEMKNLREIERLSNTEIARRLDTGAATITKHIGPTPPDISSEARSRAIKAAYDRKVKEAVKKNTPTKYSPPYSPDDWETSTTIHELGGLYASYRVDTTKQVARITFIDGHCLGELNKADLIKLIDEFSRIVDILEK